MIAVEPDPVAFEILKRNMELNSFGDVELYPQAIADTNGEIVVGSGYLGASTTRINRAAWNGIGPWVEQYTVKVPCSTLGNFIARRHAVGDPLFIKMDVEGAEEQIISSSFEWIAAHKPVLFVELHPGWWKEPEAFQQKLYELGKVYGKARSINQRTLLFAC